MVTITGTYFNGQLKLDRPLMSKRSVRVTITFEEETVKRLQIPDFSFLEIQALLKDYKGSFSDEVIKERRCAL